MNKVVVILGGVLVLVLGFAGVVAMQPATTHVERSITVAATPADVFPYANDYKKFREWNPWDEMDPNIQLTYADNPVGVGAWYEWKGNDKVGSGRMDLKESVADQKVVSKVSFIEPWPSEAIATLSMAPEGDQTRITWAFDMQNNFMSKGMGLFMDMDAMLGKDFQHGLDKLPPLTETAATARLEAERAAAEAAAAEAAAAAMAGTDAAAPPAGM